MKTMNVCALATVVLMSLASGVTATDAANVSWPCEQALVPEVSFAVVWDGPDPGSLSQSWTADGEVAALVRRLTARGANRDAAETAIDGFAAQQPVASRNQRLTLLFAGVLETLNADRRKLISGIQRYSRDQERRARALDARLAKLVALERETSEDARRRFAELRDRIEIEQRIFDDREQSIPFLCTRPRVVEQRLGELARLIASVLE